VFKVSWGRSDGAVTTPAIPPRLIAVHHHYHLRLFRGLFSDSEIPYIGSLLSYSLFPQKVTPIYANMPLLLRPSTRLVLRPAQRCAYSSAPAPAINVTNVPAPHSGSIRILSLNRPAARNAISRQLLSELHHQVNSIHSEGEKGSTRALILASDIDTSFCAGADLKERATFTQQE
jgi:hypothetical protein